MSDKPEGANATDSVASPQQNKTGQENGVAGNVSGRSAKRKPEVVTRTPDAKRPALNTVQSDTVFRILVKESKVGSVIGKAGSIVRQLRDETGARIRVVEGIPGCDERVIIISSKPFPSEPENSAQRGLFAVHNRIVEGEQPQVVGSGIPPGICTRLLVCHSQAGSIIGRKGQIIKELRDASGAHIKILQHDELPMCALANDRVVQVVGTLDTLKKALELLSQKIRLNPAKEKPIGVTTLGLTGGMMPVSTPFLPGPSDITSPSPLQVHHRHQVHHQTLPRGMATQLQQPFQAGRGGPFLPLPTYI